MNKMEPLDKSIRNKLEHVVVEARDITETAARAALEQLGVGDAEPFAHLTEEERGLRRRLRVHGRQLGDILNSKGDQEIDRLIEEVAYEHWHRMLFARFLAENNLLMYPDPENPVAVSLQECEDLASDEGANNGWELAARFATRMLPQIFRPESPVFQLELPPEHQQRLERLVVNLPKEVFTASDSLGWVYQFWQTKKKDEINASEVKIGALELPAVTQLFTEPYMVSFLLDNSLGAWWAARQLTDSDLRNAASEAELRQKAALPGVPLKYLRFVKQDDESWIPAAGTFESWPEHLSEFKILDPCCGSGHFLVAVFLMLVPMRMKLEGLSARKAVDSVLHENINGLELDQRCVELAAFSLALTAWRYPEAEGFRMLPEFNIACSGLAISAKKEEWLSIARSNTDISIALEILYDQFLDSPLLGSLINPEEELFKGTLLEKKWEDFGPLITEVLYREEKSDSKTEIGIVAQGITKAAKILTNKYHLIITNVPYLARSKQNRALRDFCKKNYSSAKNDLATVFLERCLKLCLQGGSVSIVIPQNWMFLTSYKQFRIQLLESNTWNLIGRLGFAAFDIMDWWAFNTSLVIISKGRKERGSLLSGIDASEPRQCLEKAILLQSNEVKLVEQSKQLDNPDAYISFESLSAKKRLRDFGRCIQGILPADRGRLVRLFWEQSPLPSGWKFFQGSFKKTQYFNGWHQSFSFKLFTQIYKDIGGRYQGIKAFGQPGISISKMRNLPVSLYSGYPYDGNAHAFIPYDRNHICAVWVYMSSGNFVKDVRSIDQKVDVTNATIEKAPFDLEHWTKIAQDEYPFGLPKPYSEDPTQWIFHGHPIKSNEPLQVAIARLLGYRWPAELESTMQLSDEARAWVEKSRSLLPYADEDGVLCIPPVRGEASGVDRLLNLLAAAYGNTWNNDRLAQLLRQVDHAGKTLETWLRDKFFTQHCKLFHHCPFIWHIWDGLPDGFAALVNYHKLDAKLLETLIYTYLGDWIGRQKQDQTNGTDGAEEKIIAAEILKKNLELILKGEAPYDIFVRWKTIEKQPIGWKPDLNDGVRLNIRPFLTVPDVGRKGAGVLRDKPNINWNKDRGKDVKSAPWYHLGPQYGGKEGDRINDHHLSLAEKRAA